MTSREGAPYGRRAGDGLRWRGGGSWANAALVLLGFLALVLALREGRLLLLPVTVGGLLAFVLNPLVRPLTHTGIPRSLASAVLLLALAGGAVGVGMQLLRPAGDWLQGIPNQLQAIEHRLRALKEPVETVNRATEQVERIADIDTEENAPAAARSRAPLSEILWSSAGSFVGGSLVALISCYFMLSAGDGLLRSAVRGLPTLRAKRAMVRSALLLREHLTRYLVTITIINACLALVVAAAMACLGVPHPLVCGALIGLLNYAPYLGPSMASLLIGLLALAEVEDPVMAFLAPVTALLISGIEGQIVTPMILGRRLTIRPLFVFLGVLVWYGLWGVPGALLAVPILVFLKLACEQVPQLSWAAELLSGERPTAGGAVVMQRSPARQA